MNKQHRYLSKTSALHVPNDNARSANTRSSAAYPGGLTTYDVVGTDAAWTTQSLTQHADWVRHLRPQEVVEVDAAVAVAKRSGKPLLELTKDDFPLPTVAASLASLSDILENGIGAQVIRGLSIEKYSDEERQLLFWGIGLHLGTAVSQSDRGERLMSIKDAGGTLPESEERGINTRCALTYHTDLSDVVGMFSLHPAKKGGQSTLVSAVAIHDEIARTRPDLLQVLYEPFCYGSPEWDSAKAILELRPIFSMHEGKFVSNYVRDFIEWAPERGETPPLTARQVEALDYLDAVSNAPSFGVWFTLEAGELLFFNNFTLYHSRNEFENDEDPEKHRHLLRLWLSVPNSRELPDSYAISYGETKSGALRGGLPVKVNKGQQR